MNPGHSIHWRRQQGVSMVVVLILLLVITLLGLAVLRGTLMGERMSANMYDRSLAFQSAESALREAEVVARGAAAAGMTVGLDCTAAGQDCPAIPTNAYAANPGGCAAYSENCWIDAPQNQVLATQPPQFYIQYMGQRDSTDELDLGSSANSNQYGGGGGVPLESVYRVFARSHDPSKDGNRAVVVLQANIAIK